MELETKDNCLNGAW